MTASSRVAWLVCANRADTRLMAALHSCLRQEGVDDAELILVANGPQAEVVRDAVLEHFSGETRVRILTTAVRHLTFSLSLGLHATQAPLLARMDADDLAHPTRLQRQLAFMDAHPEVAVLGSAYALLDENDGVVGRVDLPLDHASIVRALPWRNPLCHPAVMMRRAAVLEAGGYLGGIYGQDYDLWVRLATRHQQQLANLPEALVAYRRSGSGAARRARAAYATAAAAQMRAFVEGHGARWLGAAMLSAFKAWVRGRS